MVRPLVSLPVNGGVLKVRRMGGNARLQFDDAVAAARGPDGKIPIGTLWAAAYVATVCNDDGSPMWDASELQVVAEDIPSDWLDAVWTWACANSGLMKAGQEEASKN